MWHDEDCLGTGGGWEVLMLIVGWFLNGATAAATASLTEKVALGG